MKKWKDKNWLYNEYIMERNSSEKMAREAECSSDTILAWLRKYSISIRARGAKGGKENPMFGRKHSEKERRDMSLKQIARNTGKWHDRDWLYTEYVIKKRATTEMAKEAGCDHVTILKWLRKYDIPVRTHGETKQWTLRGKRNPMFGKKHSDEEKKKLSFKIAKSKGITLCWDKKWLYNEYIVKEKPISKIASELGCNHQTVWIWLKRHNIPRRSYSEARRGGKNPFFGKTHTEETVKKIFIGSKRKPNRFEQRIGNILKRYYPEFHYNGDFSLGIIIGRRIPDFVNTDKEKEVIECFGEPFHEGILLRKNWKKTEFGTKAHYSQHGYKCLVLWYSECERMSDEEIVREIEKWKTQPA